MVTQEEDTIDRCKS